MLMRGLILPVALAVVLLSGCGKNEQSASQSERASSSSLPAAGDSAPSVQLKPGLWESSFEVEDIAFKGMPGGDQPMLDNMKSSMRRTALRYRSAEHTSELQSLMRISYAGLCFDNHTTTTKKHR